MAIKQQPALTKADFEAALVTLRLSVSEVSRESGIPRHVVSHFRNYGDGMKPEQIAKLRDWLESNTLPPLFVAARFRRIAVPKLFDVLAQKWILKNWAGLQSDGEFAQTGE